MRSALQRALALERYDVSLAEDGQQALDTLAEGVVDAIGLSGWYTLVAMVLNTARVPLPADATPALPMRPLDEDETAEVRRVLVRAGLL